MKTCEVIFTSVPGTTSFNMPTHRATGIPIDIVTGLRINNGPLLDLKVSFRRLHISGPPRERTAHLRQELAQGIAVFCIRQYVDREILSSDPILFDCHSALNAWAGKTTEPEVGIGDSEFALRKVGNCDQEPSQPYAIYGKVEGRHALLHSYLGLGVDAEGGRNTFSVRGPNEPPIMATSADLGQGYALQPTIYKLV
jgi:hypothetical protein